ncbi:MAG: hypothetical protein ACO1O1_07915 [Adhaeribacter sp.]
MATEKKVKSFANLIKPSTSSYDFDKEMVGIKDIEPAAAPAEAAAEEDLLELVPFSTRITKGTYQKVRQFEYWERATITEIVEMALIQFLEGKEGAATPLPEKELKRLEELSRKKKKGQKR